MSNSLAVEGWQFKKLQNISETYAGGTPSRSAVGMYDGSIPWVKSSELNRREISHTEEGLTVLGYRASSAKWVPANTPLIAMYGATAGVVSWLKIPAVTNQAVLAVTPFKDFADPRWLYWVLCFYSERLVGIVQGSGQPNLSKKIIDELEVGTPLSLSEQRKIASILDTIDQAIALTDAHITKLKKCKVGLLHDLLSRGIDENGELRDPIRHPEQFKDSELGRIPKEWDILPIGALLESIDAGKSPSCPDRPAISGEWGVLKVSAVHPEGFKPEENKAITNTMHIKPEYQVHNGDLLITRANTYELVGYACLVENAPENLLISDKTLRLNTDSKKITKPFLHCILQMPYLRTQIQNNATGSSAGMKNISQDNIKNFLCAVPNDLDEQELIVKTVNEYNKQIGAKRKYRDKLKLLKQGLIADLLTGKVRVKVEAKEEDG